MNMCPPPPTYRSSAALTYSCCRKLALIAYDPKKKPRDMSYLPAIRKKIPLPVTISSSLQQHGK